MNDGLIEEAAAYLSKQLGYPIFASDLPAPRYGKRWSKRFPCLFCGSPRAANISYELGHYHCFADQACDQAWGTWRIKIEVDGQEESFERPTAIGAECRFREQIDTMAGWFCKKFKGLLARDEARQYCCERIRCYAGYGHQDLFTNPADFVTLRDMEKQADVDHDRLDQFVSRKLKDDLIDLARHLIAMDNRESSYNLSGTGDDREQYITDVIAAKGGETGGDPGDLLPDVEIPWDQFPYCAARYRDDLTIAQTADRLQVSPATVKRKTREEIVNLRAIVACQRTQRDGFDLAA